MLSRVAHDVCHAQPVIIVHNDPVTRELALTALRSAGHEATALADPMAALLSKPIRALVCSSHA